jgi:hypothetical protein
MDEHLRRTIDAHAEWQFAGPGGAIGRADRSGDVLFIVSRSDTRTYSYLKRAMASGDIDVVLDRRNGDRRRARQATVPERRGGDRRQRDVTADLQMYGWALVHR